jgi:hypothetical protein
MSDPGKARAKNLRENVDSTINDNTVVERCGDLEQLKDHFLD